MRVDDDLKYFEEPEFKEILAKYEAARKAGTSIYLDADELTDVAEYYSMVQHDEERANEAVGLALQLHPDAVDPQIFKARQFMTQGNVEMAWKLCDAIDDQQHREVLFLRAELLVREERLADAEQLLCDAAQKMTEDKDFFLYDAGYIFLDYHYFNCASDFAIQLENMAPDWYKTWQLQADVQLGLENYKNALAYIERMLDVDPFSTETWNWSAEAYCGLSNFTEAMNSLEYALAVEPDNERACQLKAWVLMQQGNCEEAHRLYQHEIERTPDNEQNWFYDSYCLLEMEQIDAALAAIEKAEALAEGMSQEKTTIYEQHAQLLSCMGRVEDAIGYINKAEQETFSELGAVDFELMRARVLAENQRPQEAIDCIARAETQVEEKEKEGFLFRAGQLLFDTGYYDVAHTIIEGLLQHSDDEVEQAEYHAYLAYCAMEMHNDVATLEHLLAARDYGQEHLRHLFSDEFPNVQPFEYYNYYYYRTYGRWP